MHLLLEEWDNDGGYIQAEGLDGDAAANEGVEEVDTELSLHALNGKSGPSTFKIKGYVGKKAISILIDSGSTKALLMSF